MGKAKGNGKAKNKGNGKAKDKDKGKDQGSLTDVVVVDEPEDDSTGSSGSADPNQNPLDQLVPGVYASTSTADWQQFCFDAPSMATQFRRRAKNTDRFQPY